MVVLYIIITRLKRPALSEAENLHPDSLSLYLLCPDPWKIAFGRAEEDL